MSPLISVIVPIYNVENCLRECLDSILVQTYKNLEIILVDDGSPDNCGVICDDYQKQDDRVIVIHKQNGGLSDARNAGLDICTGDYIAFIDSDDYVSPFFIEILYKGICFNGADITTCYGAEQFSENSEIRPKLVKNATNSIFKEVDRNEALKLMFYQRIANGVQYRLYKRYIFDYIRFPVGYVFEDVATTYKTFIAAKKMTIVDTKIYAYRVRMNSIVRMAFTPKKMIVIEITKNMFTDICTYNNDLKKSVASRAFAQNYHVFLQVPNDEITYKKAIWNEIKRYRWFVLADFDKDVRLKNRIAALISLCGMTISYRIGRLYLEKR